MQLIKRGQRSAAVADLQGRLGKLGFEIAGAERGGVFGPSTEVSVQAFQQKRGLVVDGIVGEATWRGLVEASWNLGERVLSLVEPPLEGDDVRELQLRLNALGFSAGKHDGIFGVQTKQALQDFQRNLAVGEDGIAGLQTFAALERLRMVVRPGLGPRIREREERQAGPRGLAGKRIAVDPGHGGGDPGETGPSGASEAELTFALSARLSRALEEQGAVTMLTRGPLQGLDESARARLANAFEADLCLSLHLNSSPAAQAQGAATYFFEREGVASEPGEHLAEAIQSELTALGRTDCRTHGKTYTILRETRMPAVLIEPAFVTNPAESQWLTQKPADLITALVTALRHYFA
jgi:N-acetylmuramoyl-L-alanine amidase